MHIIFLHSQRGFEGEDFFGVAGDELVFGVGGDYFDEDVIHAGKEDAFTNIGFQEGHFFPIGEVESFADEVDGGGGLFEENLHGGVGNNSITIR